MNLLSSSLFFIGRHLDTVKILLENNADINHQDIFGFTALTHACLNEDEKIVEILLEKNADPNISTTDSFSYVISRLESTFSL